MKKNSPAAIPHQNFAVHYEQLRCDVLDTTGDRSIGLALFLRNGMAAWMHADSCVTSPPAKDAAPPTATTSSPAVARAQAAVILAGMILNYRPEKLLCQPTCRK